MPSGPIGSAMIQSEVPGGAQKPLYWPGSLLGLVGAANVAVTVQFDTMVPVV